MMKMVRTMRMSFCELVDDEEDEEDEDNDEEDEEDEEDDEEDEEDEILLTVFLVMRKLSWQL